MIPMSLQQAAINTGGLVLGNSGNQQIIFSAITTDSREAMPESLFIALKGDNFNAHDFIDKALTQGAVACMLDEVRETPLPIIKVDNTLTALGQLAGSVRAQFDLPCIGITGSCGKTTVKEMIASILSNKGQVMATKGNFNNAIGVPLTLFRLTPEDQFAVIEMGASKAGDIDEIAQLVNPDVALITNVAAAHLQGMGTLEGVAKVKGELLDHLQAGGTAVLEQHSPWLVQWKSKLKSQQKLRTFSSTNAAADYYAAESQCLQQDDGKCTFVAITPVGDIDIQLSIPGKHNVENALAAMAAAMAVAASLADCQKGLAEISAVQGRLEILTGIQGCRIINDSYNANPQSLLVAMQLLSEFAGTKILVLGDMAELGDGAITAHSDAGKQAKALGLDGLYATGKLSHYCVAGFGKGAEHFHTKSELATAVLAKIKNSKVDADECTILVKGSRSAAMEEIVKILKQPAELNKASSICY